MTELYIKLGELLKADREQKGISLEDLSTRLKISEENLRHIERGDTKGVASELYFTLFAKSYSEALGIDYSRTIDAIRAEIEEQKAPPADSKGKNSPAAGGEESEASKIKRLGMMFGAIVVVFALFLTVYKLFWAAPAATSDEGTAEEAAEQVDAMEAELAAFDWNVPKYNPAEPLKLTLTPKGESWATILADGDTVIFRNLVPGRVYNAEAQYRLLVSVGVPRSVQVELNGKVVNLADPETRRISRVYIDQLNLDNYLNPPPAAIVSEEGN